MPHSLSLKDLILKNKFPQKSRDLRAAYILARRKVETRNDRYRNGKEQVACQN